MALFVAPSVALAALAAALLPLAAAGTEGTPPAAFFTDVARFRGVVVLLSAAAAACSGTPEPPAVALALVTLARAAPPLAASGDGFPVAALLGVGLWDFALPLVPAAAVG